jgi:hypothetical protein
VALHQLLTELGILGDKLVPLRLEEPVDPEGLRDHRGDDAQELQQPLVIPFGPVLQLYRERPDWPAMQQDRDADEAEFPASTFPPGCRPMKESWILADQRHHLRLTGRSDFSSDSLAQLVPDHFSVPGEPQPGAHVELASAIVEQRHGPTYGAASTAQNYQESGEACLKAKVPAKGLTDIHKCAEFPGLTGRAEGAAVLDVE